MGFQGTGGDIDPQLWEWLTLSRTMSGGVS